MAWTMRHWVWMCATSALATAGWSCLDAYRFEPPARESTTGAGATTGGGGEAGSTGGGGSGGAAAVGCVSSSDCPWPTSVCDPAYGKCVECLHKNDCGFKPGTVCDAGVCGCPGEGTYCGPGECVDVATAPKHCGECGHACFGDCLDGGCSDAWEPMGTDGAPAPRSGHVAVWTGSQMIVWGGTGNTAPSGALATGGVYTPKTYQWLPTSMIGAPAPRVEATAVWTGSEMIVWGGRDTDGNYLASGGRFDPSAGKWTPIAEGGAPSTRSRHTAVWTGSEMIVWGGFDGTEQLISGGRYDPSADGWTPTTAIPSPAAPRERHGAAWTGSKMWIFGGFGDGPSQPNIYLPGDGVPGGRSYDPKSGIWEPLSQIGEPAPRADLTAVYGAGALLVFGGVGPSDTYDTGFKYQDGQWSIFKGNGPSARRDHTATWIEGAMRMVVFGGRSPGGVHDTGAVLDPLAGKWIAPTQVLIAPRWGHTAVSVGDGMIVWGGAGQGDQPLGDGALFTP